MAQARQSAEERGRAATPVASPMPRLLAGLRILVVENNEDNLVVATQLLGAAGAQVSAARDGLEAVQQLSTARVLPDLVLMDMQMPVMDGVQATRQLRAMPTLKDLPIVALTANVAAKDREICLATGMNDHVGKPFDLTQLVMVILNDTRRRTAVVRPPQPDAAESAGLPVAAFDARGVDLPGALRRLGQDVELYREMLACLTQDLRQFPNQLRGLLAQGDARQASRLFPS